MISHSATKDDILRDIRRFCCECVPPGMVDTCENKKCPLWRHRRKRVKEADPTHLFRENDKGRFMAGAVETALQFGVPFTMERVRAAYNVQPLSQNWWGGITATREWRKHFSRTGRVPTSGAAAANHRRVVEWQPKTAIQKRTDIDT